MFRRQHLLFLPLPLFFFFACNQTNDATITTDIQAKMFADPQLKSASIDVDERRRGHAFGSSAERRGPCCRANHRRTHSWRQAMTKGPQVKIPSETRLDFIFHAPVAETLVPHQAAWGAAPRR